MKQKTKQLIMTLALLMTAATSAWAESKPIGLNVEYAAGDVITSTTDVYVYYGEQSGTLKKMGVKITSTQPLTISMIFDDSFGFNGDDAVYYLPDGVATGGSAGAIPCVGESTGGATVVHVASGSGTLTDPYVFGSGPAAASATSVDLTRGTGEKINEWTLTNGMPAGNVTVSVEYYPQATMLDGAVTAATDVKATTEDALVTIDKSKLTGVAKLMYFVSTDAEATAPAYTATGWTDVLPTAANYTEAGPVNVWYYAVGADSDDPAEIYSDGDICAAALTVTLGAAPLWNAEFDLTDAPEADKAEGVWKTDITGEGVKKGQTVTVTYTGSKKVLGVKAEKKAAGLTYPIALSAVTSDYIGSVVTTDGNVYATVADATAASKTAAAMIAYVSGTGHGLALALADESEKMIWKSANSTCSGKTPAVTGCTWKLATKDEWINMINAAGGFSALRDGFSSVGGTNMLSGSNYYWSSTTTGSDCAWSCTFSTGNWFDDYVDNNTTDYVRACLAF